MRSTPPRFTLTTDPYEALASNPDIVVEVLGGLEPARSAILAALSARIPVVTANKSLLAAHGDELFAAAARAGVPLLYEASVLAGVPFLSTFRRRPLARTVTGIQGILNGTSNFILSRMARDGADFSAALADAQRLGYAEPDPSKDIDGDDAVEKLCVLLRHFGDFSVAPSQIERRGIRDVGPADLQHAAAFGGALRPVAVASWCDATVTAYAGPAFVESRKSSVPRGRRPERRAADNAAGRWPVLQRTGSRPVGHCRHGPGRCGGGCSGGRGAGWPMRADAATSRTRQRPDGSFA